jgi:hypothetical protein
VIFNLAHADLSGHLTPGVQDPGPYTFDIVVTEHDGAAQVDRYGYKEPYCLWVPAVGGDGKAGHDARFAMAEGASAPELRVMYWLNDQGNRDAQEMAVVVLDPTLDERANEGVAKTVGARHEGADEDSDGEADWIDGSIPDWIPVYTVGSDDIGGDWRALWTGADACGPLTQHRRTHDEQRMLVANRKPVGAPALGLTSANYGANDPPGGSSLPGLARASQAAVGIARDRRVRADGCPIRADHLRKALDTANVVCFAPGHCSGDALKTQGRWYGSDSLLVTTKPVLEWYLTNRSEEYVPYALLGPYVEPDDAAFGEQKSQFGLLPSSYSNLRLAFVSACHSNAGPGSICAVLKCCGGTSNVLGYTQAVEAHLCNEYVMAFWEVFRMPLYTDAWHQYGLTEYWLNKCATDALAKFWDVIDGHLANLVARDLWAGYLGECGLAVHGSFVRLNGINIQYSGPTEDE